MKFLSNVLIVGSNSSSQIFGVTSGYSSFNNSLFLGYESRGYSIYQYGTQSNYFNGRNLYGTLNDDGSSLIQVSGTISTNSLKLSQSSTYISGSYSLLVRNTTTGNVEQINTLNQLTRTYVTGTGYTFSLSDTDKLILASASNVNFNFSVPAYSSVGFTISDSLCFVQWGTGTVSVTWSSPVIVNSNSGYRTLKTRYTSVVLVNVETNVWLLLGNLR